jgi:hypothetical protein
MNFEAKMTVLVKLDGEIIVIDGDKSDNGRFVGVERIEKRLEADQG